MKKSIILTMFLLTSVMLQGCSTGQSGTTTTEATKQETTKAETTKAEPEKTEGTTAESTTSGTVTGDTNTGNTGVTYKAGSYTANAQGYGGNVIVTVTVNESKITAVSIEGPDETDGIGTKAIEEMPGLITAAQSSKVDTVAGATITSQGIIEALDTALKQAAKE